MLSEPNKVYMDYYKSLKRLIIIMGVLLFIQYWLGMTINLFTNVPIMNQLNFLSYSGGLEVLTHILNGFLILIISSFIIYYSVKLTNSTFSTLTILSSVFVGIAIIFGLIFLLGGMNDSFSIAMAMVFITVYSIYFYIFYLIGKAEVTQT